LNAIQTLYRAGQSVWCDNLGRAMIESGELKRLMDLGIVGITSNPTIFMKAITGSNDYDDRIAELLDEGISDINELYERLVVPDIADAADILRPVYDRTGGVDGFVSLEVNPLPGLNPGYSDLCIQARASGWTYERLINTIVELAAERQGVPVQVS